MGDKARGINMKYLSIFIFTSIVLIIIGIFFFASKPMDEIEKNDVSIKEDLSAINDDDSIEAVGSIYLPSNLRVDYNVKRKDTMEKTSMEIFYKDTQSYAFEYYQNENQSFIYIPSQEKTINLEGGYHNNLSVLKFAKGTLTEEKVINGSNEEGFSWQVSRDNFLSLIRNGLDDDLTRLIKQISEGANEANREIINPDDAIDYFKTLMQNEPVVFKAKQGEKGMNIEMVIQTLAGELKIKESLKTFDGEILMPDVSETIANS